MKKKTVCALAICAALSTGITPVPQFDAPAVLAAEAYADTSLQYLPLTKRTLYFADGGYDYGPASYAMEESALYPPGTQVRCRLGSDGRMEFISMEDVKG